MNTEAMIADLANTVPHVNVEIEVDEDGGILISWTTKDNESTDSDAVWSAIDDTLRGQGIDPRAADTTDMGFNDGSVCGEWIRLYPVHGTQNR